MIERLDAFMARANAAYYATHDPFADFTTAPEITQVFGEVLGLWAAVTWELLGSPQPVLLVEAGPGRGTLMADALRAVGQVAPAFRAAVSLHLIETSPRLRDMQALRLPEATWHERLDTVPAGPLLLVANEFLDALPIRQLVRRNRAWSERFVGPNGPIEQTCGASVIESDPVWRGMASNADHPSFGKAADAASGAAHRLPTAPGGSQPHRTAPPDEGAYWSGSDPHKAGSTSGMAEIYEICEPARTFVAHLAERVTTRTGAALFLDYGPKQSTCGDSLQAIAQGRPADPFSAPGTADLTAHVDFAGLATIARASGAAVHGPIPQGLFLAALGLFQRTDRLARAQTPARAGGLIQAAQRLAEPDRMGRLFKAMAICHPACPVPPGFPA